jgi:DNA-binding transcriptional MerR regulator
MSTKRYTTIEASKKSGVPRATLQYWISTGKLKAPPVKRINGKQVRYWTTAEVDTIVELRRTLPPGPYRRHDSKKT